jgi:hypothetical protein
MIRGQPFRGQLFQRRKIIRAATPSHNIQGADHARWPPSLNRSHTARNGLRRTAVWF